jgi:hypothetical protein
MNRNTKIDLQKRWERLEALGLVQFKVEPDDCPDLSYLDQDDFADERISEIKRANCDGVWGIVGAYKLHGRFATSDSCWGFIGDDWQKSGYDVEIKATTIATLRESIRNRCRHCMGTGVQK